MLDSLIFLLICTLSLGGLGGSFQPSRLLIIFCVFYILFFFNKIRYNFSSKIKITIWIYAFWIFYGVISLLWSSNPEQGFFSELLVMSIGMSSILIFSVNTHKKKEHIINAWVFGFLITLPIAWYEIITFHHFMFADTERILGGININAPFASIFFGNWNNYCVYIGLCFPFVLWKFFNAKANEKKLFLIFIFSAFIIVIINGSRGALIALVIQLLVFLNYNRRYLIKGIITLSLVLLIVWAFIPNTQLNLFTTYIDYRYSGSFGTNDGSSSLRLNHVKSGVDYLIQTFGFGIGAGSFETDVIKSPYYMGIPNAHNILIEIGAQYGIWILLLFFFLLYLIVHKVKKIEDRFMTKLLISCVLTVPIIGAINSKALGYTYWWVFLNSLLILSSQSTKKHENSNAL